MSSVSNPKDGASFDPPGHHVVERSRGFGQRKGSGDELVELESSREVQLGEQRDVAMWARGSVSAGEDRLVVIEPFARDLGVDPGAREPDDHSLSTRVEQRCGER